MRLKIILLSFFLLIINLCNCKNENVSNKLPNTIRLQENDTIIIESVDNILFYEDFFLVVEKLNSNIIYYNYKGEIIDCIKPNLYLVDSLVGKVRFIDTSYHCISLKEASKILEPYGEENLKNNYQLLKHQFSDIIKLNDSLIIINSKIYGYANKYGDTDRIRKLVSVGSLIHFNIYTKHFEVYPFDNGRYYAPKQSKICFSPNNKKSIIAFAPSLIPLYESKNKENDSIWALCEYSIKGKFSKFISKFPEEFVNAKVYCINFPMVISNSKNIIAAYPSLPRLYKYNCSKGTLPLFNIKTKYLLFYKKLEEIENKEDKKAFFNRIKDFSDFAIKSISFVNDSMIQVLYHIKSNDNWVNYLQYINTKGELISQKIIDTDSNNTTAKKIHKIFYSPEKKLNAKIYFDENGWSISFEKVKI